MNGINLVVGNSSLDNIVLSNGTFLRGVCGGNSFHAAMAASILSKDVAVLTAIPSNYPSIHLDRLSSRGVDVSMVKKCPKAVECEELFVYERNGDRRDNVFLDYNVLDALPLQLGLKEVDRLLSLDCHGYSFKEFHDEFKPEFMDIPASWRLSSVHLAPTSLSVHKAFLGMNLGVVTLDPGRYLIGMPYEEVVDMVSRTMVFAPSRKEMSYIFPNIGLVDAVKRLGSDCGTNIVCKNGGDGSIVYDSSCGAVSSVGVFPSNPVDFTGAGDSFCGALNVCLAKGIALVDAVRMATVVAAKAIETVGATQRDRIDSDFVEGHYMEVSVKKEFRI